MGKIPFKKRFLGEKGGKKTKNLPKSRREIHFWECFWGKQTGIYFWGNFWEKKGEVEDD